MPEPPFYDWSRLLILESTRTEIHEGSLDVEWVAWREAMKGLSPGAKYYRLLTWLKIQGFTRRSRVQVSNYVNAIKRARRI